jgi:chromosome partitioning protein
MDLTTNEETAAETQDPQSHRNGMIASAGSTSSGSASATGDAVPPAEVDTAYGEAGELEAVTSRNARFQAGWFSAESDAEDSGAAQNDGARFEQVDAERPGDEPSRGLGVGEQASARASGDLEMGAPDRARPVGAEDSTVPDSRSGFDDSSDAKGPRVPEGSSGVQRSAGPGKPTDGGGPSSAPTGQGPAGAPPGAEGPTAAEVAADPVGPQASSGRDTETVGGRDSASFDAGSAPGRQELRGPELIQAGTGDVNPDPEVGSPPGAAGWSERSATGLVPDQGPSDRPSGAAPQGSREEHARARDVDSPDADPRGGNEGDVTSMDEPAPTTDRGEAGTAADESATATATEMATNAVPRDVTTSSQGGPADSTEISRSSPPSDAEDASSIAEATAGPDALADDSHVRAAAAKATTETGSVGAEGEAALGVIGKAGGGVEGEAEPRGSDGTGGKIGGEAEARGASEARDQAKAGEVTGPADATDGSSDATADGTPWDEPALPMGWPPGIGPPVRGEANASSAEEESDSELLPEPDPTWPRLFGHGLEGKDSDGTGGLSNYSQPEQAFLESNGGSESASTGEPGEPMQIPEDRGPSASVAAVHDPGGQSADQGMTWPQGVETPEPSPAVPAGFTGGTGSFVAPGHADTPPDRNAPIVDITAREPESSGGPGEQPGLGGPTPETGRLDVGASASRAESGVGAAGRANISTGVQSTEAAEVDPREASPGSVDVSRETSPDGGEAMDPGREDEALEDEAAIAVRDAVSRAAAEAGVDVSRETDPMADFSIDEPSGEAVIDSESAARNARVPFRIHHDAQNGVRRVLAVANQKGGVGKSTTAVNIGAYLALAGARVLVIDLDPQGNASTGLGLDHREIEPSIYDVLTGEAAPGAAIRATGVPGLHVLPSTIDLAGAEVELVSAMSRETRLRRALQSIDHQYDTILVDCPPSLGLLTVNALAAADELLIPIQCEYYALEGLGQLLRNVELVRANLNPELRIGGIVLTMYDGRTRLALQVVEEVRKHFTDIVYQTVVPRSVRLSEAPGYGLPIALYDPLSRGGIAYRDLTFELAERSGLLSPTGEGAS